MNQAPKVLVAALLCWGVAGLGATTTQALDQKAKAILEEQLLKVPGLVLEAKKKCRKEKVCDYFAPADSCANPPCCKTWHFEKVCDDPQGGAAEANPGERACPPDYVVLEKPNRYGAYCEPKEGFPKSQPGEPDQAKSFTGSWDAELGQANGDKLRFPLALVEQDGRVKGTVGENGNIAGTIDVQGRLIFTMHNAEQDLRWHGILVLAPGGESFAGHLSENDDPRNATASINGTRR